MKNLERSNNLQVFGLNDAASFVFSVEFGSEEHEYDSVSCI